MIGLIVVLIFVAVLLWVVETMLPLDPTLKRLIHVVAILAAILYIARFFGVF